uniref:N-formylglutamate amidohydrolase n=1 Tax=Pithovirus LCPAC103 TaxID=2506588 RepID=A0A481Z3Q7_9VIRU|nr:MAG: N-formylglutamate amidohydrolase [Pithovirus LCPAC103]
MPIIITVAHAICVDSVERDCDRRAAQAAQVLYRILQAKKCEVYLRVAGNYRDHIDANRTGARSTLWRRQLRTLIREQLKLGPVFVLDVHSFPAEADMVGHLKAYMIEMWFRSKLGGKEKVYQGWSANDKAWAQLALKESLGEGGTKIMLGDRTNDIMITSNIIGASTAILELNEAKTILSDEELETLMIHLTDELLMKYC